MPGEIADLKHWEEAGHVFIKEKGFQRQEEFDLRAIPDNI
jgi:hypothetical protein